MEYEEYGGVRGVRRSTRSTEEYEECGGVRGVRSEEERGGKRRSEEEETRGDRREEEVREDRRREEKKREDLEKNWGGFGPCLGSFWRWFWALLGLLWRSIWGSFSALLGVTLEVHFGGSFWTPFLTPKRGLGPFWRKKAHFEDKLYRKNVLPRGV